MENLEKYVIPFPPQYTQANTTLIAMTRTGWVRAFKNASLYQLKFFQMCERDVAKDQCRTFVAEVLNNTHRKTGTRLLEALRDLASGVQCKFCPGFLQLPTGILSPWSVT